MRLLPSLDAVWHGARGCSLRATGARCALHVIRLGEGRNGHGQHYCSAVNSASKQANVLFFFFMDVGFLLVALLQCFL